MRLEAAYQLDLGQEKRRVFLSAYILCTLLYALFGVLDIWALPSAYPQAWGIRAAVVGLGTVPCLVALYRRNTFVRYYTPLICATYTMWAVGILAIILLARPEDPGWSAYYGGLMLVSMALYTWTYLLPRHAAASGFAIALAYILMSLSREGMQEPHALLALAINCSFLLSANLVGLFSLYTRERFSRQNFMLRKQLRRDLKMEEQAKLHSEHRSEHDALTGLPNRVRFLRQLEQLLESPYGAQSVVVLFLDLDGFKPVNDLHGHAAGDHVLRCVAQRILGAIRASDLAARLGGDEFVLALALPDEREATVQRVMRELSECLSEPVEYEGKQLTISCSIGFAYCPDHGTSAAQLMEAADQSMYEFKRARKVVARAA